ncbi:MAG: hypothetical protein FJ044_01005 [Candidatus Cloacimonetes bacterium]|nr:hypothetical protein [Candidatus Cloacimonadota bacterium]
MNEREQKVFLEFFTNIAVAWFSAGVIAPFFRQPKIVSEVLSLGLSGAILALASLKAALFFAKEARRALKICV